MPVEQEERLKANLLKENWDYVLHLVDIFISFRDDYVVLNEEFNNAKTAFIEEGKKQRIYQSPAEYLSHLNELDRLEVEQDKIHNKLIESIREARTCLDEIDKYIPQNIWLVNEDKYAFLRYRDGRVLSDKNKLIVVLTSDKRYSQALEGHTNFDYVAKFFV